MRIEFDPTNPDEASAVRAMLTAMHGAEPGTKQDKYGLNEPEDGHVYVQMVGRGVRMEPSDKERWNVHATSEDPIDLADEPGPDTDTPPTVDSNGEPHDPRIHSSPPKTNADGTWRAKRGVKAEEIAAVRAEREALTVDQQLSEALAETAERLQESTPTEPEFAEALAKNRSGLYMTDVPVEEQSAPPAPDAPVGEREIDVTGVIQTIPAPKAPPAPPAPAVESHPLGHIPSVAVESQVTLSEPSFLDVMKAITAAQKDGKIDTAKVRELCAAVGAGESTMGLNGPDNGDKRGAFMALLASETEGK